MNDHHNPEQSDEEARSRARHPSGKAPGGHPTADACILAGDGHYHLAAPEEPSINGHLGNTEIVFYRHVMDTHCHGLISWTWTLDLDAPDDEEHTEGVSDVAGPARMVGFTEEDAGECDYCLLLIGQADEEVTKQAKTAYANFHMGVARRAIRILTETDDMDLGNLFVKDEPTGLDSLRAWFRGEK